MWIPRALPRGMVLGGRYRIETLIGSGAFGAVFRAVSIADDRAVALKVVSPEVLERAGGVARFRREAQLVSRLAHPNSVRILGFGEDPGGYLFIAFELLEGRPLDAALEKHGALPERRAATFCLQILAALEEAHAAGVIHRDIKPANVFLTGPVGRETVKVLDFGLAKSTNRGTLQGLTSDGSTVGTPMYMAPEQIMGGPVTPATDLFALGIVLAEMLHGAPLYPRDVNPLLLMKDRIMGARVPLPDALTRSPFLGVIERATELDVARRFESAIEMTRAILPLALAVSPSSAPTPYDGGIWSEETAAVGDVFRGDVVTEKAGASASLLRATVESTADTKAPARVSPLAASALEAPSTMKSATKPQAPRTVPITLRDKPSEEELRVTRRRSPRRAMLVTGGALALVALATLAVVSASSARPASPRRASSARPSIESTTGEMGLAAPSLVGARSYFVDPTTIVADCKRMAHGPTRIVNVLPHELRVFVEDGRLARQYGTYDGKIVTDLGATELGPGEALDVDAIDFSLVPRLVRDAEARAGRPGATFVSVSHYAGEATVVFEVQVAAPPGAIPQTFRYDASGGPLAR